MKYSSFDNIAINHNCSNIKRSIVISIMLFVSIIGIILYYQEKQLNTFISTIYHLRLLENNLTNFYIDLKNDIRDNKKSLNHLLEIANENKSDDFNKTVNNLINSYKIQSYHPINIKFKNCFPLSDYNNIIEKLFDIDYNQKIYSFNYNKETHFNSKILPELLKLNNYIIDNDNNKDNNDNDNNNDKYYDENFNELNMNTNEYYEYLWNKYIEYSKTINSSEYNIYNLNKYNFMYNLKYYFDMKNKNKYIHKKSYKIINNIYENTTTIKYKKNCILNKKLNYNISYNNTYEYSLIPINDKDFKNHFNNNYNLNQLNNYYGYMCNSYSKLCGNLNNYYNNMDQNNYLYYYPYFKSYNVNVFNYIFNRMYKSFVNFDIEQMINNTFNINKMSENILIGVPIEDKNIKLIYDMFPNTIKPTKII